MGAPRPQTLVSCLFDLERRERIGRRPIDFYFRHAELVLGLEQPLLVYADPDLAPWLRESRRARGLEALTRVVERPLEALPTFHFAATIQGFRTFANSDPLKGTALHQAVQWAKFDLLDEAMLDDPFGTDHFAWIDLGLGHVAVPPVTFPAPTHRVAVLEMRAVAPAEAADRLEFLGWERGRIAAGFFRGHRETMERLVDAFRTELGEVLEQGFRPNEQMVLGYLTATRPELFELYYGDYAAILCNWDHVRRDLGTVFLNLRHCRDQRLWRRALDVSERTLASAAAGALELTAEQRARLLDERTVAAWHAGRRSEALATLRALLADGAASAYVAAERERLAGNLALMEAEAPAAGEVEAAAPAEAPAVSVVIPVHDGERTLARAVHSALAQSWADLEVVIVDDGSGDGSPALARELATGDPRVRVLTRPAPSGGPATPRDEGVAAARGRFVALLDQDDYWLPDKLAAQMPLFDAPEVAVVYSDAYFVRDGAAAGDRVALCHLTGSDGRLPEGDLSEALLREDCVPCLTAVIRREWLERIGRFDRHGLVGVDDYYAWLRIALSGGRFAAVQRPLAVHCQHPGSLGSVRTQECDASRWRMWEALRAEFPSHPSWARARL